MSCLNARPSKLITLLITNALAGALVGALVSACLLLTDTWGVSTLIRGDANPMLAAVVFIANGVLIFATVMISTAIFLTDSGSDAKRG